MSMCKIRYGLTRGGWLLVALSAALNISCGDSNTRVVRDTTGATFLWTCPDDERCEIEPLDAPRPAQCGRSNVSYSYSMDNFIKLCSVVELDGGGWFTNAPLCRFVACDADDECPEFPNAAYACSAGLCQNVEPTRGIVGEDVILLCMADAPRPLHCRAQVAVPEVAAEVARALASCDSAAGVCTVPADCRQP
ncbi:hypothetical protein [Polyangium mundeleinium]|uniref:Lipoprotein n=1 Tax=Polyangium mundeleinium TaxID=2995306 RepID=A0ABT5ENV5_9BACT|nr:hypothetical protein [Polyangium mundeleinium]MDC0742406.1 hypothetical protein [Polyangium mundeleinium]